MEHILLTGEVVLHLQEPNQNPTQVLRAKNLVVANGKRNIARLLGGASTGLPVSKIAAGSSNAAATDADTGITNAVEVGIQSVTYPNPNQVQFNFSFTGTALGGMTVKELGLLNNNNDLIARKTTGDIQVAAGLTLSGYWIITVNS